MEIHLPDQTAPVRGLPELFDLGVKARSLAYLFVAGAAVGALTLVLPHASEVDDTAVLLLVIAATVVGGAALPVLPSGCASGTSTWRWRWAR